MFRSAILLMTVCFLSTGCTQRLVDFTAISTKNVKMASSEVGSRVEGADCVPVVFFPLGQPNMKEAIDRAIEKSGANYDALIDGVVYAKVQSFVFGRVCYTVEGTPINTKK